MNQTVYAVFKFRWAEVGGEYTRVDSRFTEWTENAEIAWHQYRMYREYIPALTVIAYHPFSAKYYDLQA